MTPESMNKEPIRIEPTSKKVRVAPKIPEDRKNSQQPEIKKETEQQLRKLETRLTGDDLGNISRSEAFIYAKTKLDIKDPLNFEKFGKEIKQYQLKQAIKPTGVVDKATYMEMKAGEIKNSLASEMTKNNISQKTMQDVLYILKEGNFSSINSVAILYAINQFKDKNIKDKDFTKKYGKFYQEVELLKNKTTSSKEGKVAKETVSKNEKTIVSMVKNNDYEGIAKDPMVLASAGIMFLFGVFGSKSEYTDKFWKRFGIILGVGLFGKQFMDKIGVNEIIEDAKGVGKTVAEGVGTADYSKVPATLKGYASSLVSSSKGVGKGIADLPAKMEESYKKNMGSLQEKNEGKKTDKPNEYIHNFSTISSSLNQDDKFMNTKIEDLEAAKLEAAKGNGEKIKGLLNTDTQNKLYPSNITALQESTMKSDLEKYVDLILERKSSDMIYVKELFIDTKIIETFKTNMVEHNVGYISNPKLDDEIKVKIGQIEDKETKAKIIYLLSNLNTIEEDNNRDNYKKLSKFLLDNPNLPINTKNIIEEIRKIFLSETILEDAILAVNKIKLADGKTELDSLVTIDTYSKALEKIQAYFKAKNDNKERLENSDNSKFEKVYNEKKLEIYKKGAEIEAKKGISNGKYSKELNNLEEKTRVSSDSLRLKELSQIITDAPNETAKPIEFKQYYEKFSGNFKEIETIEKNSQNEDVKKLAKTLIEKYTKFTQNYEKSKESYATNLSNLEKEINITIDPNIDEQKAKDLMVQLESKSKMYETYTSEIIEGFSIVESGKFLYKHYIENQIVFEPTNNSIVNLDDKIGADKTNSNKISNSINKISTLLKEKLEGIEDNYKLDIDFNDIELTTPGITKLINNIKSRQIIIDALLHKGVSKKFKDSIIDGIKTIQDKFVNKINTSSNIDELNNIYGIYYKSIQKELSGFINKDIVKDAYYKKVNEFERERIQNLTYKDEKAREIFKNSGLISFFQKYGIKNERDELYNPDLKGTQKIDSIVKIWENDMDETTTIKQVIDTFENNISIDANIPEKVKAEAGEIVKNINVEIEKEIQGKITYFFNKLFS